MKKQTIKGWAIIANNKMLSNWAISYAIFHTKKEAKLFLPTAEPKGAKVVPCKITLKINKNKTIEYAKS